MSGPAAQGSVMARVTTPKERTARRASPRGAAGGQGAARAPSAAAPCTLFGSQGSGSAAVEMALRRCGWHYRVVRASTWERDSAQAELAAVNPLGQIPALVLPDGAVLTESAAILIHLALEEPTSGLLPLRPGPRAQALQLGPPEAAEQDQRDR